jgi:N-methylhydantoinase A/oxoprolinase/acetone carboxylase beta subunit
MFSIYGESGRIFRGAMEELWRVEALRAVMRTRRLQAHESVASAQTKNLSVNSKLAPRAASCAAFGGADGQSACRVVGGVG